MALQRIQRSRRKGSRQPPNTVYGGRPSKWANPFVIGQGYTREESVATFRAAFWSGQLPVNPLLARMELSLFDYISCWCRRDQSCHCDEYVLSVNCYSIGRCLHCRGFIFGRICTEWSRIMHAPCPHCGHKEL